MVARPPTIRINFKRRMICELYEINIDAWAAGEVATCCFQWIRPPVIHTTIGVENRTRVAITHKTTKRFERVPVHRNAWQCRPMPYGFVRRCVPFSCGSSMHSSRVYFVHKMWANFRPAQLSHHSQSTIWWHRIASENYDWKYKRFTFSSAQVGANIALTVPENTMRILRRVFEFRRKKIRNIHLNEIPSGCVVRPTT